MSGPALLEKNGAQAAKPSPWTPIFIESFFEGQYSNRNALHDAGSRVENMFYGGRPGSLFLPSQNVEISVRNTIIRRYGTSAFSTAIYPTIINTTYSLEASDGTV